MKLIITKGKTSDEVAVHHPDGQVDTSEFPKQGVVPHDAVHWIVEGQLAMASAFWGTVSSGLSIESVAGLAKEGGHASAKRAGLPDAAIVEMVQAERLVECFEADMWSTPSTPEVFREVLAAACAQSHVEVPQVTDEQIEAIRRALDALRESWVAAAPGEAVDFGTWMLDRTTTGE